MRRVLDYTDQNLEQDFLLFMRCDVAANLWITKSSPKRRV
jgi:hypothetical protein